MRKLNSIPLLKRIKTIFFILIVFIPFVGIANSMAAENLTLKKGISFVEDKDLGFPIVADKMDDYKLEAGKPTLLFFGASGDLNTARQSKRLVNVYNKMAKKSVKFVVINVDQSNHLDNDGKNLIKKFYRGYIPCQVVLDTAGNKTWSKVGEVSEKQVVKQLNKQLK